MSRSEKECFHSFCAISNEKTVVIPVQNGNVAVKNRNVTIDNGKVEIGEKNVAEMKNTEFETFHASRANAKEARCESNTLTELADKANASFDVCQIINGLSLMSLDADTKAIIDEVIGFINGQIHQYTVVYRRHTGVVVKKKTSVKKGEMLEIDGKKTEMSD
jgi:hypothetical protein